ncbi:MAG: hypothetical protein Fues2KO_19910 [Fuerstiella sp.]
MNQLRKNAPFIVVGFIVCGLAGYFLGGSEGRAFGGGVGILVGLVVGGIAGAIAGRNQNPE